MKCERRLRGKLCKGKLKVCLDSHIEQHWLYHESTGYANVGWIILCEKCKNKKKYEHLCRDKEKAERLLEKVIEMLSEEELDLI